MHGPRDSPVANGIPAENAIRTYRGYVLHGHVPSLNFTLGRNPTSSDRRHAWPSSTLLSTTSVWLRCMVHLLCIRATPFPSSQCDGRGCAVLPPKRISRPIDGESRPSNADPTAQMDPPPREQTLQVWFRPTLVPPDTVHNCVFVVNPSEEVLEGRRFTTEFLSQVRIPTVATTRFDAISPGAIGATSKAATTDVPGHVRSRRNRGTSST